MERTELITSKEYWVETLETLQQQGHTHYDIATVIANRMKEAINYTPCCTELKPEQECYKSGEPCEYNCSGLCKESCQVFITYNEGK